MSSPVTPFFGRVSAWKQIQPGQLSSTCRMAQGCPFKWHAGRQSSHQIGIARKARRQAGDRNAKLTAQYFCLAGRQVKQIQSHQQPASHFGEPTEVNLKFNPRLPYSRAAWAIISISTNNLILKPLQLGPTLLNTLPMPSLVSSFRLACERCGILA